jgi:hypothetical protein
MRKRIYGFEMDGVFIETGFINGKFTIPNIIVYVRNALENQFGVFILNFINIIAIGFIVMPLDNIFIGEQL